MIFAASVGLALAALAGPALGGQVTAAGAATAGRAAQEATVAHPEITYSDLSSYYYGHYVNDCGVSCNISTSLAAHETFGLTGSTGKWWEIKSADGYCLDLVGSGGVYYVNEESCNGRAAELWWLPSTHSDTQIINDYGTSLLSHDACLWNQDANGVSVSQIRVEKCLSGGSSRQDWDL